MLVLALVREGREGREGGAGAGVVVPVSYRAPVPRRTAVPSRLDQPAGRPSVSPFAAATVTGAAYGAVGTATVTARAEPSCAQQPRYAEVPGSAPARMCRSVPSGRTHRTRVCSPPPGAVV